MNYWEEKYPNDFNSLLKEAEKSAQTLLSKLNNQVKLNRLYNDDNKVFRYPHFFDLLQVEPTIKHNTEHKFNELAGIYLFGEKIKGNVIPIYVGISKTIARRLKQHGWGSGHNQSSFAYLMAKEENNHQDNREDMSMELLEAYQKRIQNYYVSVVPMDEKDPYKLYLFEVLIAGILKTKWNSFKTH